MHPDRPDPEAIPTAAATFAGRTATLLRSRTTLVVAALLTLAPAAAVTTTALARGDGAATRDVATAAVVETTRAAKPRPSASPGASASASPGASASPSGPPSGWSAPVGIPTPSFGVAERAPTYSETNDSHYFVDNSRACNNTNNGGRGSAAAPRCSVPTSLGAGALVEVRGGPYPIGDVTWTLAGTRSQPVFVRGTDADNRAAFTGGDIEVRGSYFVLEFLDVSARSGVHGRVRFTGTGTHHAALRHSYVHDSPGATGSGISNATGNDIVIYGNEVARVGTGYGDGKDVHGFWTGCATERVWIVDNHIHHTNGDAIQFGHGCWNTGDGAKSVYIGRNRMHEDRENAIDLKQVTGPVVISANIAYGYRRSPTSSGDAIRVNDEGSQGEIWILNNRVHGSDLCINPARSASPLVAVVGNVLYDCATGVGEDADLVVGNTIVNTGSAIRGGRAPGPEVQHNVIATATSAVTASVRTCTANAIWHGPLGRGVSCAGTVGADPLLVMDGARPTGLQAASPAVDAATEHPVYGRYRSSYGLDIRVDITGRPRPAGGGWDLGAFER